MKVRIMDVSEKSAHYRFRDDLIGVVGEVVDIIEWEDGWYFVHIQDCDYSCVVQSDGGRNSGYGKDGDDTFVIEAKYEIVK